MKDLSKHISKLATLHYFSSRQVMAFDSEGVQIGEIQGEFTSGEYNPLLLRQLAESAEKIYFGVWREWTEEMKKEDFIKCFCPEENRPVVKHKHTKGEWFASGTEIVSMPSQCKITNRVSGWNYEEALANANLIASAPELLQIAEMYFDSMKGTSAEGSLPFNITLAVLNKLK